MSGNLSPILYRPLPIMNKQEIITKVKNPPGEILSIVCILNEMFLAFKRCCDYCQSMDCESCLFFFSFQFGKQVLSESSHLRSTVGAVPESSGDL